MSTHTLDYGEALLTARWLAGDEAAGESILVRYEKHIFNLTLYLGRCDRDTAYSITVSSFQGAAQKLSPKSKDGDLLQSVIKGVVERCKELPSVFTFDVSDFSNMRPEKKQRLSVAKEALFNISFEHRLVLLLRDQMNLSITAIALVLGAEESQTKSELLQARIQFSDKVQIILKRMTGQL